MAAPWSGREPGGRRPVRQTATRPLALLGAPGKEIRARATGRVGGVRPPTWRAGNHPAPAAWSQPAAEALTWRQTATPREELTMSLADQICVPCRGEVPPLTA